MKLLVTGANGFVGRALCEHLARQGHTVTAVMRDLREMKALSFQELFPHVIRGLEADFTQNLSHFEHPNASQSPFLAALREQDAVIHCAARVHQVRETAADPLQEYLRVNCEATLRLAHWAAAAGVKRFVYLSSIKVHGDFSLPGQPFRASDALSKPLDPYGLSKWQAEQGLREIERQTGLQVVIVRPPLVYGAGVKANFLSMMRVLQRGIPLPFGAIKNTRSLVALPNLVDFIALCAQHPQAAGQDFLVSDQTDVSTPQLLRLMGQALGQSARLISVPPAALKLFLQSIGKGSVAQRLMSDLAVDSTPINNLLSWQPPVSIEHGLALTASAYLVRSQNAKICKK